MLMHHTITGRNDKSRRATMIRKWALSHIGRFTMY